MLALLIVVGGLAFNIGNIAGTGLGLDALVGLDPTIGAVISATIAIAIFLSKRAGVALDRIVVVLGLVMIVATIAIAVTTNPPVGEAVRQTVLPDEIDILVITTLIGGTVGGYITYAGAHRLIETGETGPAHVRSIARGSVVGILVTGVMRMIFFLAILGVTVTGAALKPDNPAAAAFEVAAGEVGLRLFGLTSGPPRSPRSSARRTPAPRSSRHIAPPRAPATW